MLKPPLDLTDYPRDPRSCPAHAKLADGLYVYVQAADGTVWVLPDGPHLHFKVLGRREPALYAGDLRIEGNLIRDVTNLSGTFQFDDPAGLLAVADQLLRQGLHLAPRAVRFFDWSGFHPPLILQ